MSIGNRERCLIILACVCLMPAGGVGAEILGMRPATGGATPDIHKVMATRGVWYSSGVYLPFYADKDLCIYLADMVGSRTGILIVPVYAGEPIHFRRGPLIFVSTGLILQKDGQRKLLDAVRSEVAAAEIPSGFDEMQSKLAEQVTRYEKLACPRLRRRP